MKIYQIDYVEHHGIQLEWFSSRENAESRRKEVIENNKNNCEFDGCICVGEYEIEMNEKGIVKFLNTHCDGDS